MMCRGILTVNRVLSDKKSIDLSERCTGNTTDACHPREWWSVRIGFPYYTTPRRYYCTHTTSHEVIITKAKAHKGLPAHMHLTQVGVKTRPALLKGSNPRGENQTPIKAGDTTQKGNPATAYWHRYETQNKATDQLQGTQTRHSRMAADHQNCQGGPPDATFRWPVVNPKQVHPHHQRTAGEQYSQTRPTSPGTPGRTLKGGKPDTNKGR
jgi:hypothetical protein